MEALRFTGRVVLLLALTLSAPRAAAALSQPSSQPQQEKQQKPQTSREQPVQQPEGSADSPSDPSRVKRALEQPSSGLLESATKRTERLEDAIYRVNVTEKPLDIWEFWGEMPSMVPSDVRSWYFSNWHQEYLRMTTPDYARRAALYPQGMVSVPVIPLLENAVKNALRVRAERRAKEEVQDALEQFFREHPEARYAAPSPPAAQPPDL